MTRPYTRYWFELDIERPETAVPEPDPEPRKSQKPSIGPVPDFVPAFIIKGMLADGWRP